MNGDDYSALPSGPQAIGPAYYNEHDPYAAQWMRNLQAANLITPGLVDERDIRDVRPSDLRGFARTHFFAGIGVWDYALGLAGWPADRPVWTGSCPCQPFSAAGRRGGVDDERHLWPHWHHLIRECRPGVVLGEQVASKDGLGWLDLVHADLEGEGYAVGAVDLCAAGVGAPHIRQRLWFVADAGSAGRERRQGLPGRSISDRPHARWVEGADGPLCLHEAGAVIVGDAERIGLRGEGRGSDAGAARGVPDPDGQRQRLRHEPRSAGSAGFWSDADWIPCRDGKARPVEPGTFPLAHGAPARVGRLRAYGNAINAEAARAFVSAVLDCAPDHGGGDVEHLRLTAASVLSVEPEDIFA